MELLFWISICLTVFGCLFWIAGLIITARIVRRVPALENFEPAIPENWAMVSILVPARNEEESIMDTANRLLDLDYPSLEIILINDRSDDGTGRIMDELAGSSKRIKVVHITDLPQGWLGKAHALDQGLKQAQGDWLLFMDADIRLAKRGILLKSVAYAEEKKIDFMSLMPRILSTSLMVDTVMASFFRMFCLMGQAWKAADPESDKVLALGAFSLARRTVFDKTPGFEWLKLEVSDDVGLALMMKEAGAVTTILTGFGLVSLKWYDSFSDMVSGLEKNFFAILGRFSLLRLSAISALLLALYAAPLISLFAFSPNFFMAFLGLITLCCMFAGFVLIANWSEMGVAPALLAPLGDLLIVIMSIRAGVLGLKRGGIYWRDSFYPSKELKKGMRVKF